MGLNRLLRSTPQIDPNQEKNSQIFLVDDDSVQMLSTFYSNHTRRYSFLIAQTLDFIASESHVTKDKYFILLKSSQLRSKIIKILSRTAINYLALLN